MAGKSMKVVVTTNIITARVEFFPFFFSTSDINFMLKIHEKLTCLVLLEWQTWQCATTCNTFSDYFGCSAPVRTACYTQVVSVIPG
jgi:hypothetical protein